MQHSRDHDFSGLIFVWGEMDNGSNGVAEFFADLQSEVVGVCACSYSAAAMRFVLGIRRRSLLNNEHRQRSL